MSRIPRHVLRGNRAQADADANARFYNAVERGQYELTLHEEEGRTISIDIREFVRDNLELTPAERRKIRELGPGEELRLGGGAAPLFTLRCIVPQEARP